MNEKALFENLLHYLKTQFDNHNISYKQHPTKLTGGLHTRKYIFTLEKVPKNLSKPLVTRIYPLSLWSGYSKGEALIQNAVNSLGFPAPKVYFHSTDKSILGGEFTIMEYKEGVQLFDTDKQDIPETVAILHKQLHELDSQHLIDAAGIPRTDYTRYSMLDYLKENIPKKGFSRLYPALDWVIDHQHQREPVVLCHGDFHADNILWHKGKVSAVLDWGTFRFEEPVYDVARQIVSGYAFLPIARPMIDCQEYIERYYRKYLAISQVDSVKVEFYKSLQCLYCFFAYENGVEPYGIPQVQNGLIETFKNLTGIEVPYLSR